MAATKSRNRGRGSRRRRGKSRPPPLFSSDLPTRRKFEIPSDLSDKRFPTSKLGKPVEDRELATAVFGAGAAALAASGLGPQILNKKGKFIPAVLKQLIILDEVLNPGVDYALKRKGYSTLFGRETGYDYTITPVNKEFQKNKFYLKVQKDLAC